MKSVILLFMSVYLLLLSVLACSDSCERLRPEGTTPTIAADTHHHSGDTGVADHCSPLCSCSCCGMVLETPPQFYFVYGQLPPTPTPQFGLLIIDFPTPLLATWQPPQLS